MSEVQEITELSVFTEAERLAAIDALSKSMFDPAYTGSHLFSDGTPAITGFIESFARDNPLPTYQVNVNVKILYGGKK